MYERDDWQKISKRLLPANTGLGAECIASDVGRGVQAAGKAIAAIAAAEGKSAIS